MPHLGTLLPPLRSPPGHRLAVIIRHCRRRRVHGAVSTLAIRDGVGHLNLQLFVRSAGWRRCGGGRIGRSSSSERPRRCIGSRHRRFGSCGWCCGWCSGRRGYQEVFTSHAPTRIGSATSPALGGRPRCTVEGAQGVQWKDPKRAAGNRRS